MKNILHENSDVSKRASFQQNICINYFLNLSLSNATNYYFAYKHPL